MHQKNFFNKTVKMCAPCMVEKTSNTSAFLDTPNRTKIPTNKNILIIQRTQPVRLIGPKSLLMYNITWGINIKQNKFLSSLQKSPTHAQMT